MAYRQTASPTIDSEVLCLACGAPHEVAIGHGLDEQTFRCRGCTLVQPVLRDDEGAEAALSVHAHVPGSYIELSAFARSLGASQDVSGLDIRCAGTIVQVSLSFNSGQVQGIDLVAKVARRGVLPSVRFVDETSSHRDAKSSGLAREVQTGDSDFDQKVYVESNAADADVLRILASPAVRRAIARVLELGADAVTVDDAGVRVSLKEKGDAVDAAKMAERVRHMRTIVGGPRPLAPQAAVGLSPRARRAFAVAYSVAPLAVLTFVLGMSKFEPVGLTIFFVGFPAGLIVAALVQPLLARAVSGRSTSQRDLLLVRIPTLVGIPFLVTGLLVVTNGAADRSEERIIEMDVTSTSTDTDDSSVTHVHCVDAGGGAHSYPFRVGTETISKAYYVRTRWRSGALGFGWESGKAILTDSPRQTPR